MSTKTEVKEARKRPGSLLRIIHLTPISDRASSSKANLNESQLPLES